MSHGVLLAHGYINSILRKESTGEQRVGLSSVYLSRGPVFDEGYRVRNLVHGILQDMNKDRTKISGASLAA